MDKILTRYLTLHASICVSAYIKNSSSTYLHTTMSMECLSQSWFLERDTAVAFFHIFGGLLWAPPTSTSFKYTTYEIHQIISIFLLACWRIVSKIYKITSVYFYTNSLLFKSINTKLIMSLMRPVILAVWAYWSVVRQATINLWLKTGTDLVRAHQPDHRIVPPLTT